MTTETKREKLRDYVETVDDEEIETMFTVFEDQLAERFKWWEDEEFVAELEQRVKDIESGKDKGVSWEEVKKNARLSRAHK